MKDTLAFVRELDVFEPDDGHPPPLEAVLRSPYSDALLSLSVRGAQLSFEALAGGVENLVSLSMTSVRSSPGDWAALRRWRGLANLQLLEIRGMPPVVSYSSFWDALSNAPKLHTLVLYDTVFDDVLSSLRGSPSVAVRLEDLSIQSSRITDSQLAFLAETPGLTKLRRLDLRKNKLTAIGVACANRMYNLCRTNIRIN